MSDHHIIGNNQQPARIDRTLVDKLNEEARRAAKRGARRTDDANEKRTTVTDMGVYLRITNLQCVGSDGEIFERYDALDVRDEVVRNREDRVKTYTLYDAILFTENLTGGAFLPSFALQCNILAALYEHRELDAAKSVLAQYKDRDGANFGYEKSSNTLLTGDTIIHYPTREDFTYVKERLPEINKGREARKSWSHPEIAPEGYEGPLEEALHQGAYRHYLYDLTGLREPEKLIEIAAWMGTKAIFCGPQRGVTSTTGIGCIDDRSFFIIANNWNVAESSVRPVLEVKRVGP